MKKSIKIIFIALLLIALILGVVVYIFKPFGFLANTSTISSSNTIISSSSAVTPSSSAVTPSSSAVTPSSSAVTPSSSAVTPSSSATPTSSAPKNNSYIYTKVEYTDGWMIIDEINTKAKKPYITVVWTHHACEYYLFGDDFNIYYLNGNKKINCYTKGERNITSKLNKADIHSKYTFDISGFDISKHGKYLFEIVCTCDDDQKENIVQAVFEVGAEGGTTYKKVDTIYDVGYFYKINNYAAVPLFKIQNDTLYLNKKAVPIDSCGGSYEFDWYYSPKSNISWSKVNKLNKIILTEENFDNAIYYYSKKDFTERWKSDKSPSDFREENLVAYRADVYISPRESHSILILQQKDGSMIMLTCGFKSNTLISANKAN